MAREYFILTGNCVEPILQIELRIIQLLGTRQYFVSSTPLTSMGEVLLETHDKSSTNSLVACLLAFLK